MVNDSSQLSLSLNAITHVPPPKPRVNTSILPLVSTKVSHPLISRGLDLFLDGSLEIDQ